MSLHPVSRPFSAFVIAALVAQGSGAAEDARTRAETGRSSAPLPVARQPASKSGTARGPLPDPVLLDGSTLPAEKKSEQGMIGDFELPGDENARSGQVGGPQNQNPNMAGGGPASNNMPMGMPKAGGGAQGKQSQQNQAGGAQGGAQAAQSGAEQAGGSQGGAQSANAGGNPVAGGGDAGAQPQGIQVAELGGDAAGQQQAGGGPGEKPSQVAIGDSAMRIETSGAAQAGVVGAQQVAGQTQQHEKGTGSGGKGAGGTGGGNRVEKGRVIPAGL